VDSVVALETAQKQREREEKLNEIQRVGTKEKVSDCQANTQKGNRRAAKRKKERKLQSRLLAFASSLRKEKILEGEKKKNRGHMIAEILGGGKGKTSNQKASTGKRGEKDDKEKKGGTNSCPLREGAKVRVFSEGRTVDAKKLSRKKSRSGQ